MQEPRTALLGGEGKAHERENQREKRIELDRTRGNEREEITLTLQY